MKIRILLILALFFFGCGLLPARGHGRYNGKCSPRTQYFPPFHQPQMNYNYIIPPPVIYFMPQERIPVDVVTAEGVRLYDRRVARIVFYLGRCGNGDVWCQVGVTPSRFRTEDDALRWVEGSFGLLPMSIRQISRRSTGPLWFISN